MKHYIELNKYGWFIIFLFFLLLSGNALFNIPLALLCIFGIHVLVKNRTIDLEQSNIRLFGIMCLCIVIPMILSLFDAVAFNESLRKTVTFIMFYFTGVTIIISLANPRYRKYLLYSIFFLMCFWIFDAVWQSISGKNILGYPYDVRVGDKSLQRLTGVFYPHKRIGIILANLSPFYFEFLRIHSHKRKWILLLIIPLIYVVILGGSRSSYIMLLLSMILYASYLVSIGTFTRITRNHVVIVLSIFILGGVILSNSNKVFTEEKYQYLERRISSVGAFLSGDMNKAADEVDGRIEIWEGALWIIRDNWINGIGPRGFRYVADEYIEKREGYIISEYADTSTHPHQYVLEVLTETGIIGIIGYVIFLIILYRQVYLYFRNDQYRYFLPWTFPALIATMPVNMHKAFYSSYISVFIWVTVAIVMSLEMDKTSTTVKQ